MTAMTSRVVEKKVTRRITVTVHERVWSDGCRTGVETTPEEHARFDRIIADYQATAVCVAVQNRDSRTDRE